jgi:hypothetical protein
VDPDRDLFKKLDPGPDLTSINYSVMEPKIFLSPPVLERFIR